MSATTAVRARAVAAHPARFRDLLASEWLKLWSLRSMRWALVVTALAIILLNANAAYADYVNWSRYDEGIRAHFVPDWSLRDAFSNNSGITLMLIAASLGSMAVVSEYATGMVRTTFAAVPARRALMTAKVAVLTAVMTVYGVVIAGGSFWLTQAILSGRGVGISITYPGVVWGVLASALLAPVSALVGFGLGALIRHSATTIVANVVVLLLIPNFLNDDRYWSATLNHALPFRAWQRLLQLEAPLPTPSLPYPATGATGSWLVFALWGVVAAVVAVGVVERRDA
ncbi:ABC transporter permease [Streptomyces sp. NPDC091292]|uniref:ABC transporter permease n=1 Tax=Streptomyces sp. NPDC091292 TaxID=3365991 RepID=UPI003818515C